MNRFHPNDKSAIYNSKDFGFDNNINDKREDHLLNSFDNFLNFCMTYNFLNYKTCINLILI